MKNCYIIDFNAIGNDEIGYLVPLEENNNIPFDIKRVYYAYCVPTSAKRGFHAHKNLKQTLICLNGSLSIRCIENNHEVIHKLDSKNKGLFIGPMVWHEMLDYEKNTVLMVLASDFYNENDYIRNFDDFIRLSSKYEQLNTKKYFIHEKAIVDSAYIGDDTRIWGFTHIFPNANIGKNCNICEHVLIENEVSIGSNVTIKSGVYIWDGVTIKDNVFVGPNVSFINDKHPRSKIYPEAFSKTLIKEYSSLGANSTIMCGITIGKCATVGAGSVVLKDVSEYEVVAGNPARHIGYNCICSQKLYFEDLNSTTCKCGLTYKKNENGKIFAI